jgi:hypothetical protein
MTMLPAVLVVKSALAQAISRLHVNGVSSFVRDRVRMPGDERLDVVRYLTVRLEVDLLEFDEQLVLESRVEVV